MNRKRIWIGLAAVIALLGGTSPASAGAIPRQHIKGHLRVDGSSDLRGLVRARSGLTVTDGISTDSLTTTGPVQVGGVLAVSGAATVDGLNAGAGTIATTGALQGGSLAVSGNATVGGSVSANAATVGSGGLTLTGSLQGAGASFGAVTAHSLSTGSLTDGGSLSAGSATVSSLTVQSGGSVNLNGAAVTGASGLNLSGASLSVSSLAVGSGGLSIVQNGQTSSLSVSNNGALVTSAGLNVTGNATVQGTLAASQLSSLTGIAVSAPSVSIQGGLTVAKSGDLQLQGATSGFGPSHLLGNADVRGQCTAAGTTSGTNTCHVSFGKAYPVTPVVVATPVGGDPTLVTGYAVSATQSGFTISFTLNQAGTVTFNYIVAG